MPWVLVVGRSAEKQLERISQKDRERLLAVLIQMRVNPFVGDVVQLRGIENAYRRRVGSWRILFDIYPLKAKKRLVVITAVVRRTSSTY